MKKNKKKTNKKEPFLYITFFLFFVFLGLAALNVFLMAGDNGTAFGQENDCTEIQFNEDQTIYKNVDCKNQNCGCFGTGENLFTFFASDANCDEEDTQMDRLECFFEHSYPEYDCKETSFQEHETAESVKEECLSKYAAYQITPHKYYMGEAGTFINDSDLAINGYRTYINGFRGGEHGVYTGFEKNSHNPISFIEESRNVKIGNNLTVEEGVNINSSSGGIFMDSNVSLGDIDYQLSEEGKRIAGITSVSRDTGLGVESNLDESEYIYLKADSKNLITFDPDFSSVSIKKGGQIHGDIKSSEMYLQDRRLHWSKPIRGNFILYYK